MEDHTPQTRMVRGRPDFAVERNLWQDGHLHVCGVDEVGRGPLAGPVVAAAVILPQNLTLASALPELDDSKRLSPEQRGRLEEQVRRVAVAVGVGQADVAEIDRINIRRASLLAMERAVAALAQPPSFLLIDGRDLLAGCVIPARALTGGDRISASIAAASIIAKEVRDRLMRALAVEYPGYGWERNMGYPTLAHRQALIQRGLTPYHRRTFKPVAQLVHASEND